MKDNRTLSRVERDLEREREQHAREDRERSRSRRSRPSAARAVQRIKGMARGMGIGTNRRSSGSKRPSQRLPAAAPPRPAALKEYARRAFVRTRFVSNKKLGQWAAHARYLEREGAQQEGLDGVGFDAASDAVSMTAAADRWQSEGDRRLYKLVLSPEDGGQLDLVRYTRGFMADLENQVGKPLEWAAIDHHNTDNPHVHVILRGRGLDLAPDLVRTGMRTIAENHATQQLGYKSEAEKQRDLDRDITARRFTQLDRLIKSRALQAPDGTLSVTETSLTRIQRMSGRYQKEEAIRIKRIARLQKLEELGVATKVGAMTWKLDDNWESALKQLEVIRTRSTMLLQHRELMTDPRCLPQVTKLKPGESLVGRSLGGGLDETTDRRYLLVEGADSRAHFIDRPDTADAIKPGALIRLEGYQGRFGRPATRVIEYDLIIPASGFAGRMKDNPEVAKAARDEIAARTRSGYAIPEQATATAGFAAHMQRAMIAELERQRAKRREKENRKARGSELDV